MRTETIKAKKVMMAFCAMLMPLLMSAHDFEVNSIYYNVTSDTDFTVAVTYRGESFDSYSDEYSGDVEIPSSVSYEGAVYSVTGIGDHAFLGCSNLSSISIPKSVTDIGNYVFRSCTNLASINIPEGVKAIGITTFGGCSSLSSISIPSSVTSIDMYAFVECSSLTTITIPESVKNLGSYAFAGCSNLTSVILSEGLTSLGELILTGCSNLASITCKAITPPSVKNNTFNGIKKDVPVYVPAASLESYKSPFSGGWGSLFPNILPVGTCGENLTWRITPEEVLLIEGEGDMYDYTSKENTPWYRESFQTVDIAEGVTRIGSYAFYECWNFTTVRIPTSVKSFGDRAFYNCLSLQEIHISDIEAWCNIDFEGYYSNPLEYGYGKLYLNGDLLTELIIPNTITEIKVRAFINCESLTSVTFPECLTSIGKEAFYYCHHLTSINIPESVVNIEESAFCYCENLSSIAVAEGNLVYDSRNDCNAIIETNSNTLILGCATTIIPEGTICINGSAFQSGNLTSIVIPEGVTSIGNFAFNDCNKLTSITLPSSITSIGDRAFPSSKELDFYCYAENIPSVSSGSLSYNNDNLYKSTLHVPAKALEDYKSTYPWSSFGTIKAIPLEKCATPTISYENGKVKIFCETEGAEVKTKLDIENDMAYEGLEFDLIPTYTLTAYATKDQYEDSDAETLSLCWIPCDGQHMTTEVTSIPSKPVLIQSQGGTITFGGLADDTEVAAYDLAGNPLDTTTATGGAATLTTNLAKGDFVIVKIGNNSIKIAIK